MITGRDATPRTKFWSAETIWKILGEVALLLTLSVSLSTLRYVLLPQSAEVTTIKKSISWEDLVNNFLGAIMVDLENVLEAVVVDKGSVLQNNSFRT
jgi:hypothetical protein